MLSKISPKMIDGRIVTHIAGSTAGATPEGVITGIIISNPGPPISGFSGTPTVTITGDGVGASASAVMTGSSAPYNLSGIKVDAGGANYTWANVTLSLNGSSSFTITAYIDGVAAPHSGSGGSSGGSGSGSTGPTGPTGPVGPTGPAGSGSGGSGATGPVGPTGPQGAQGAQGAQGPAGASSSGFGGVGSYVTVFGYDDGNGNAVVYDSSGNSYSIPQSVSLGSITFSSYVGSLSKDVNFTVYQINNSSGFVTTSSQGGWWWLGGYSPVAMPGAWQCRGFIPGGGLLMQRVS